MGYLYIVICIFGLSSLGGFLPLFQETFAGEIAIFPSKEAENIQLPINAQNLQNFEYELSLLFKILSCIAESDKRVPRAILDITILIDNLPELLKYLDELNVCELTIDRLRTETDAEKSNATSFGNDFAAKVAEITEQHKAHVQGHSARAREYYDEIKLLNMGIPLDAGIQEKLLNDWYDFVQKRNTVDLALYGETMKLKEKLAVTTDILDRQRLVNKLEFFDNLKQVDTRLAEFALNNNGLHLPNN